jgi:hypothetical protein
MSELMANIISFVVLKLNDFSLPTTYGPPEQSVTKAILRLEGGTLNAKEITNSQLIAVSYG